MAEIKCLMPPEQIKNDQPLVIETSLNTTIPIEIGRSFGGITLDEEADLR